MNKFCTAIEKLSAKIDPYRKTNLNFEQLKPKLESAIVGCLCELNCEGIINKITSNIEFQAHNGTVVVYLDDINIINWLEQATIEKRPMRVLIVDDEEDIRKILIDQLLTMALKVVTAKDGEEAIDILSKEEFDVVLTDMAMPNKPGMAVINKVLESHTKTKIIAMSGAIRAEDIGIELRTKVKFLQKPWSKDDICEMFQFQGE